DNSNSQTEIDEAEDALQTEYDALLAIENANVATTIDKSELSKAIADAEALIATINANLGYYEAVAALGLAELDIALQNAKTVVGRYYFTEAQYSETLGTLNACLSATQTVVDADCADRSALAKAITDANKLLDAIAEKDEDYYSAVDNLGADALNEALHNAQDVMDKYHTTEQCASLLEQLNNCYAVTLGVVNADCSSEDRNNLSTLIGNVNALLSIIAVEGENTQALPLQSTNADAAFYIWCNEPAGDSDGVAGLIDKNADGTANTGTFLGTNWDEDVPAYTHYIEIDLGVAGTIDQLTMDYTTRNSTHADQRPNAIKILGSNDKTNYTEITEITSGLAANANEKWTMTTPLELGAHYRYIRIAVGSDRGFFHMSDFNLYTKLSHTLDEYYTTAEGLDLVTLCLALDEAQDAAACYMTTEQYTAVYNKLNSCYTTANAIESNDYSDRNELATLKTDADALVDGVVAIDENETVLALQATDANAPYYIYCNAPGATNNYAGDNLGVAALLDVDEGGEPITATFLHTSYVAGSHDDALDHYLRVDMGESNLLSFKFRYTPRIGNTGNAPLVMLIEGSNDCVNFEEITTLTDMATTYQSGEITNGKAYRYIRFIVKDTHNHNAHDGHKFFAMSHFEMTACKTIAISEAYASPNLSVGVVANAYNELVDAAVFDVNHYLTNETGVEIMAELQAAYDALNAAIALQNIPVKLTTDVNNPVLYKIKINRTATTVLQFDNATKQVAVASKGEIGNEYQAWYFMQGTDAESNDDILILPYWNEGAANTALRLGAASTGNAAAAVWAVERGDTEKTKQNWYITVDAGNTAEGWWNIRPEGKDNYFSNNGGVKNKMGFWNSSSDDGSEFQFVLDDTDYSLSDAYFALLNQYVDCGGEVAYGTRIGTYSEVTGTAYNTAYNTAAILLEAKSSTDDEYDEARTALVETYDALEYNGGLCRIRSAYTGGYSADKLIYVDAVNNPYFEEATDEQLSKYVWEFEPVKGGYHLKSLHTQSYVTAAPWGKQVVLGDEADAKLVTIDFLAEDIVRLNVSGGYPLHAQASGSKLVGYTGELGSASAWYVEKVENVEDDIKHTVSLGANESGADTNAYSTLYLAYNAIIPEGITASIVEKVDANDQLVMTPVEGNILPANTAVVLSRETDGVAEFKYTDETPTFDPAGNMLRGASCNELVECGSQYNVYMLGKKSGRVAFYWTYENRNENGEKVTIDGLGTNHNQGGYVLCNANKAYLLEPENNNQAAAAMYSLPIGGVTTGAEDVKGENGEVKTIYDLQGRKLVKVKVPGLYIVNGKKVYITKVED
ncbi:MAG: discoidin domain-containing protein, partial [Bacteroidaceae bacterium]|nr:discoidin domain-containing protein [Bacteroidaceae bacterium]